MNVKRHDHIGGQHLMNADIHTLHLIWQVVDNSTLKHSNPAILCEQRSNVRPTAVK
jgi:hypothetical protein